MAGLGIARTAAGKWPQNRATLVLSSRWDARAVDYYRTLHVDRSADPEVIERAYKALSLKYHPDRVHPDRRLDATRQMQRINEAYVVLRDSAKRRAYDAELPPEGADGWDRFWEKGLLGLFIDRFAPRPGS
jgi:curved DNA-binding protein CbpA